MHRGKISRRKYNKILAIPGLPSVFWNKKQWFIDFENRLFLRRSIVKRILRTIIKSFDSVAGKRMLAKYKLKHKDFDNG